MWRSKNKRLLSMGQAAARLTPSQKKLRKADKTEKVLTPEERVDKIKSEIKDLESEIEKQVAKFEAVRLEMLTGIISHEGVSAKQVTDRLLEMLQGLQKEYITASQNLDSEMVARMIKSEDKKRDGEAEGKDISIGADGRCAGGCKPCDIKVDAALCMEICSRCQTTYDRRLENKAGNVSYADFHPGEGSMRVTGYKPPNHHAEIVTQFQGKRKSAAPQDIVEKIGNMCARYKIEKHKITPDKCRIFLKQLQQMQAAMCKFNRKNVPKKTKKYTDYYKHCPEIAYRLSGIPPPYMTPMQENRVLALFPMVVAAYKTSPRYLARKKDHKNRKTRVDEPNNMNYYYVFYKECELLGYTEFLPYIPLPKSLNNIDDNDYNGWKHCCEIYGWSFTPTR